LFSAFENVPRSEITISFVVTPKPLKLFEYLIQTLDLEIEEVQSGIYYIKGEIFPLQTIESKKLIDSENVFLKSLRSNLTPIDANRLLTAFSYYGSLDKVIEETKKETAFELLSRNFNPSEVASIIKMPVEWVEDLKNN
jgi:hypothetical protein